MWTVVVQLARHGAENGGQPRPRSATRASGQPQDHQDGELERRQPVPGQTFEICITGPALDDQDLQDFTYPSALEQIWEELVPGSYSERDQPG